jgi:PiT family inorganic phosphate transporter
LDGSLIIVLLLVLGAEFTNGLTDAPNAIATVVSTRVLSPYRALAMAAVLNIVGVLVTGTAVAATIGKDIVLPEAIGLSVVASALVTIILWTTIAWKWGLPTSKTHELVAGLTGAALASAGPSALVWDGWEKILLGLAFSTIVGFPMGYAIMSLVKFLFRHSSPGAIRAVFGRLQIFSAAFVAFSHGGNDGQKFMGIFALALMLGGAIPSFQIPVWVIVVCGVVMGLGTGLGGWRIVKTIGYKLTKLEPVNGFAAETAASISILVASFLGIPLSTTQTVNTAVMGVGANRGFRSVRWGVAGQIVLTWFLTFPGCFIMGYVFDLGLRWIMP